MTLLSPFPYSKPGCGSFTSITPDDELLKKWSRKILKARKNDDWLQQKCPSTIHWRVFKNSSTADNKVGTIDNNLGTVLENGHKKDSTIKVAGCENTRTKVHTNDSSARNIMVVPTKKRRTNRYSIGCQRLKHTTIALLSPIYAFFSQFNLCKSIKRQLIRIIALFFALTYEHTCLAFVGVVAHFIVSGALIFMYSYISIFVFSGLEKKSRSSTNNFLSNSTIVQQKPSYNCDYTADVNCFVPIKENDSTNNQQNEVSASSNIFSNDPEFSFFLINTQLHTPYLLTAFLLFIVFCVPLYIFYTLEVSQATILAFEEEEKLRREELRQKEREISKGVTLTALGLLKDDKSTYARAMAECLNPNLQNQDIMKQNNEDEINARYEEKLLRIGRKRLFNLLPLNLSKDATCMEESESDSDCGSTSSTSNVSGTSDLSLLDNEERVEEKALRNALRSLNCNENSKKKDVGTISRDNSKNLTHNSCSTNKEKNCFSTLYNLSSASILDPDVATDGVFKSKVYYNGIAYALFAGSGLLFCLLLVVKTIWFVPRFEDSRRLTRIVGFSLFLNLCAGLCALSLGERISVFIRRRLFPQASVEVGKSAGGVNFSVGKARRRNYGGSGLCGLLSGNGHRNW